MSDVTPHPIPETGDASAAEQLLPLLQQIGEGGMGIVFMEFHDKSVMRLIHDRSDNLCSIFGNF